MTERSRAVERLLRPRSVAIVGVSPEPGSIGGLVLANLDRFGYGGEVHLVSRSSQEIAGRRCVGTIDELPVGVDVAVLCVPQAAAVEAVAACARKEVGAAMVYAAGFAEMGGAGKAAQEAMLAAARAGGLALFGPNCIGLVNFIDRVPLSYEPNPPDAAGTGPALGVLAQSGAMASTLRLALLAKGLAISALVSTGNEADIGIEDFLAVLVEDERTKVITLFTEQIRHPQRFLALAAAARARKKPIVLMHPGRSARAQASALSHTGALTGDHAVMSALVAREAVVLVETLEELIDTAEMLARFPEPPVKGAAIVTNSGAFKGYALDFCETVGLDLPRVSDATLAAVKAVLPPYAAVENPLDVTGQSIKDPNILGNGAKHLLADDAIGSLVVSIIAGPPRGAMEKAASLLPVLTAAKKPTAIAVLGDEAPLPETFAASFRAKNIPFFRAPERVLRALAHMTAYGKARADTERHAIAPTLDAPSLPGRGTLAEYQGKNYLSALGIPVPAGALAHDMAEARAIAKKIGYPVVLKAQAGALAHKSEAGGVILNLADEAALAGGWGRLHDNLRRARPGLVLDGVLVERMGSPGLEMVVGARRDEAWGPVVLVGLGGLWIEALKDVRILAADLDARRIIAELHKLKGAALLGGLRGAPAVDVAAVAQTAAQIGALMRARPEISEIDINPLVAYPARVLALDVLIVADR
jgi:acetate---CoA ligase (ADP-forming)